MKQKGAIYYRLSAMKRPIGIFYLVIVLLLVCMILFNVGGQSVRLGAMESATMVFLLVIGCCSFKEDFYFLIQSGTGRKTILKSQVISYTLLCAGMALADTLLAALTTLATRTLDIAAFQPVWEQLYQWEDGILGHIPMNIILSFSTYLLFYSFGYCLAALSYRGGRKVTIGLSVGLPVGFFILLPGLLEFAGGFTEKLAAFFVQITSSFGLTVGLLFAGAILFFGIGGRLQLGAQVKG